jgi:hypothetical protein
MNFHNSACAIARILSGTTLSGQSENDEGVEVVVLGIDEDRRLRVECVRRTQHRGHATTRARRPRQVANRAARRVRLSWKESR